MSNVQNPSLVEIVHAVLWLLQVCLLYLATLSMQWSISPSQEASTYLQYWPPRHGCTEVFSWSPLIPGSERASAKWVSFSVYKSTNWEKKSAFSNCQSLTSLLKMAGKHLIPYSTNQEAVRRQHRYIAQTQASNVYQGTGTVPKIWTQVYRYGSVVIWVPFVLFRRPAMTADDGHTGWLSIQSRHQHSQDSCVDNHTFKIYPGDYTV